MTSYAGVLEAIERILNRGGDADDVLRAVLAAMHDRGIAWVQIRFAAEGELPNGPCLGTRSRALSAPVVYQGRQLGELEAAVDDRAFLERVATLISAYVNAKAAGVRALPPLC